MARASAFQADDTGSSPVTRSKFYGPLAQLGEHPPCKRDVARFEPGKATNSPVLHRVNVLEDESGSCPCMVSKISVA